MLLSFCILNIYSLIGMGIYLRYLKKRYGNQYNFPQDILDYIVAIPCGMVSTIATLVFYIFYDRD